MSPLNQKGIADESSKPKPAYAAVKRLFDEVDPLQRSAAASARR
jgi:hypothetical protein